MVALAASVARVPSFVSPLQLRDHGGVGWGWNARGGIRVGSMLVRIAVESTPPETRPLKEPDPAPILEAVRAAGAELAGVDRANALIWLKLGGPERLAGFLDDNPGIGWVQLPWAGVEHYAAAGVFDRPVIFTCAKSSFAEQVGEHALTLILACYRHLVPQARTAGWHPIDPVSLFRKNVTILGAGGIAQVL